MAPANRPALFPAFLDLDGKPVVIVGGGEVAARKAQALLRCGARITIVAPELCERLKELLRTPGARHRAKRFAEEDLAGAEMAIGATDDRRVNQAVADAARSLGIPVNVADDPGLSSFLMASVVERGPLQVAISTSGASPALARRLHARIEGAVPEGFGRLAELAGEFRAEVMRRVPDAVVRRRFWERVMEGPIAAHALEGRMADARAELEHELDAVEKEKDKAR